jgi:large subunit ribosomal protein L29
MKDSFKDLTFEELLTKREELRVKYRDVRFNTVVGHVDNPVEKRVLRRKISRLNGMIYNHPEVLAHGGPAEAASTKVAAETAAKGSVPEKTQE